MADHGGMGQWEVHVYEPGGLTPFDTEAFGAFQPAFERAMFLKDHRPNGWHIHVHTPYNATDEEHQELSLHQLAPL